MPKACVIYTRVSTADQAAPGHFSLEAQEDLCQRHAQANGLWIVEVLRDEGYSGRTTSRPGLRRLFEYTSPHPPKPIQTILVQDTSRVGRDTTEYLIFRRQLQERGIQLIAVTQPHIDASPEGRLVDTILAGVNQYHSEEKAKRILIAMEKKLEQGGWPGWAPLGYVNVRDGERRWVEPDPDRFDLIKLAFSEYATGRHTQAELLQFLTKKGLRDRNGKALSRTSLNDLLANPFYWGRMRWNGDERTGAHPPATDQRLWEQCQEVTARHNRYAARQRKHRFLLSGLLVCDGCGSHLTRSVIARKGKRYYNCQARMRCAQPYVPEDLIQAQVAEIVRGVRLSEEFIERVMTKVREVFQARTARLERQRQTYLRRRTVVEQQRDIGEQKLVAGVLSDEAFRRVMGQITAELDEINRTLGELEGARRFDTNALRAILQFARHVPEAYANAPPPVQRRYLDFFFEAFVVRDRRVVRTVPTEFFHLLQGNQVQSTRNWWTRLNVNGTGLLRLFSDQAWVAKQVALLRELDFAL